MTKCIIVYDAFILVDNLIECRIFMDMKKQCKMCKCNLTSENCPPSRLNATSFKWYCRTCWNIYNLKYSRKKKEADVKGLYAIKHNDKIVYVGESEHCNWRFKEHLYEQDKFKKIKDELSLVILEEVEDKTTRLIKEIELITELKPILNHPYCLLKSN